MESYQTIALLFIGYIVFTIYKKQKNFPVPMVLLLIGFGLSLFSFFSSVEITKHLLFNWFLPALLFTSAYQFQIGGLKKNIGVISVLSTIGLIFTMLLLGTSTYFLSFGLLSFLEALLVASILTPTDPVSVISIFKKSSNNPKVAEIVEGESMINDGTSIVLFTLLSHLYTKDQQFGFSLFLFEFA